MSSASVRAPALQLAAPAKINLHLRVGPANPDGFHPLRSWVATIDLCDTLTLAADSADAAAGDWALRFSCSDSSLPSDERNLVVAAARLLRQRCDTELATGGIADPAAVGLGKTRRSPTPCGRPASLHLEKRVPAGGGLGGGSSDAATALLALNDFWNLGLSVGVLADLAAKLGSDVPFFLFGPSSIIRGRGERVEPIGVPTRPLWVMLVLPPIAMPTADVYRQFDRMQLGRSTDVSSAPDWNRWLTLGADALLPLLVNDLEAPAFALRPDLGHLRVELEQSLARPVRMSGSGSSLFTLYDGPDAAERASEAVKRRGIGAAAVRLCPAPAAPVPRES